MAPRTSHTADGWVPSTSSGHTLPAKTPEPYQPVIERLDSIGSRLAGMCGLLEAVRVRIEGPRPEGGIEASIKDDSLLSKIDAIEVWLSRLEVVSNQIAHNI